LQEVNQTVARLVETARRGTQPAMLTYGTGRCDLAAHRDYWDESSGQWVCGYNPGGTADDTVLVARVCSGDGTAIAALVNYACHPTTLAWDNRLISPDYPGTARRVVEDALHVPCVFIQGASGDLGPRRGYTGDVKVAEQNGRQLGYAALSALESLPPPGTQFAYAGPVVSGATIGVWNDLPDGEERRAAAARWGAQLELLPLPYRPGLPELAETQAARDRWLAEESAASQKNDALRRRDCRAMVERHTRLITRLKQLPPGDRFPYQLRVWRMGDAFWIGVQGEPYSLLQTSLRARFPQLAIVVCSIANGWGPTYLPPAELYDRGIYQESIAVLAPGSLEGVIAEAADRIQRLAGEG
jgi:hypothetical protein